MIDLHLHSTYSDGTNTPGELVDLAAKRELKAISITDHDSIEGTAEALSAGVERGLTVIPGLEISVWHSDLHFHLLGYGFDPTCQSLLDGLAVLQRSREQRNEKILARLAKLTINISPAELRNISQGGQTGRPHIARALVDRNIVKTIDQAFDHYLKKGACAYVSRYILSVEEAISLIHEAGGISVLAHPAQISYSTDILTGLLDTIVAMGLDGIEVYYPSQKGSFRKRLQGLAARYSLVETGGSDYHGDIRPGTSLAGGRFLPIPKRVYTDFLTRIGYPVDD